MDKRRSAVTAALWMQLFAVLACVRPAATTPPASPASTAEGTIPAPDGTLPPLRCADGPAAAVPDEYLATYNELEHRLSQFFQALPAEGELPKSWTTFGAELLPANGNRGEALLLPAALPTVRLYLDRLQELGVTGVSVQISDPLLTAPDLDTFAYLEFFRQTVEEAHARGLRVLAETGPVFPDPQYSTVDVDWSKVSAEDYFGSRKLQLVLIAREIKPDYLSLGNEPETERKLTGLDFTPEEYGRFLDGTVAAIGPHDGILLGGGTGSWEDPAFRSAFLNTKGLQFLDVHIYPIAGPNRDYLDTVLESADLAKAAGKKVVVGEAWLYKAGPGELAAGAGYAAVLGRDAFSFWQPLDALFVRTVMRIARTMQFEYLSFFWSGFFFGYLDYDPTAASLPPVTLAKTLNQTQYRNMLNGELSATGCAYQAEIRSAQTD